MQTEGLSDIDCKLALDVLRKFEGHLIVGVSGEILSLRGIPFRTTAFGRQYYADALLTKASQTKGGDIVLVLTSADIYAGGTNYIFGLATAGVGLVSSARIDPSFWKGVHEIDRYASEDRTFFERQYGKVVVHEVGHALGLPHCGNWNCVMHFANSPLELYRKGEWYCQVCQRELLWSETGGDIDERDSV